MIGKFEQKQNIPSSDTYYLHFNSRLSIVKYGRQSLGFGTSHNEELRAKCLVFPRYLDGIGR